MLSSGTMLKGRIIGSTTVKAIYQKLPIYAVLEYCAGVKKVTEISTRKGTRMKPGLRR